MEVYATCNRAGVNFSSKGGFKMMKMVALTAKHGIDVQPDMRIGFEWEGTNRVYAEMRMPGGHIHKIVADSTPKGERGVLTVNVRQSVGKAPDVVIDGDVNITFEQIGEKVNLVLPIDGEPTRFCIELGRFEIKLDIQPISEEILEAYPALTKVVLEKYARSVFIATDKSVLDSVAAAIKEEEVQKVAKNAWSIPPLPSADDYSLDQELEE